MKVSMQYERAFERAGYEYGDVPFSHYRVKVVRPRYSKQVYVVFENLDDRSKMKVTRIMLDPAAVPWLAQGLLNAQNQFVQGEVTAEFKDDEFVKATGEFGAPAPASKFKVRHA